MGKFLLGADPEVIVAKEGTPVSAIDILGVGRYDALEVGDLSFHEDNILLEYNIPPAQSKNEFVNYNQRALEYITNSILSPLGMELFKHCEGVYTEDEILHPQAQEIGCLPEYNAYEEGVHEHEEFGMKNFRTAGGHIHIGYEGENEERTRRLITILDMYLGIPSIIMEGQNRRRLMYGTAGSFRRKAGVKMEYRTPSNFWLWSEEKMHWIYDTVTFCMNLFEEGFIVPKAISTKLIEIINKHKVAEAEEFCAENAISYIKNEINVEA